MTNIDDDASVDDSADDPSPESDPVARMVRRAGAELRHEAPSDGLHRLVAQRRAQLRTRAAIGGCVAAILVVAGIAVGARRGREENNVTNGPPTTLAAGATTTVDLVEPSDTGHVAGGAATDPVADPVRDQRIAERALIALDILGPGWSQDPSDPTNTDTSDLDARLAAEPLCLAFTAPEWHDVFHSPETVRTCTNLKSQNLYQDVSVYPTVALASKAMDLSADPNWIRCTFALDDAAAVRAQAGLTSHTTGLRIPPPLKHGDRQVSYGAEAAYTVDARTTTRVAFTVAVQVGRGVVVSNPAPDHDANTDPNGFVGRVTAAATEALRTALEAS